MSDTRKTLKLYILGLVIALLDIAVAASVFEYLLFFKQPVLAAVVALAFIALQTGSLILFAAELPTVTRRLLIGGAAILLTVTGLANVQVAYLHSREVFPAEALLPAVGFGLDPTGLGVAAAWTTALALVVTGLIFWTAFGQYIRQEREHEQQVLKSLDDILQNSEGVGK